MDPCLTTLPSYDKEGYSVWRVDFKYNDELTQTFMSSNQIGGFFNRLEASRKYLFGSMGVLGVANDSVISGAFILRGQDFKPVVDVAPDWESYDYKKLDLDNADDKAFFEAALAWDLEIDGKKWADGKNVSTPYVFGVEGWLIAAALILVQVNTCLHRVFFTYFFHMSESVLVDRPRSKNDNVVYLSLQRIELLMVELVYSWFDWGHSSRWARSDNTYVELYLSHRYIEAEN